MSAGSIIIDLLMRTGSFSTDSKRAAKELKALKKEAQDLGKTVGTALGAGLVAAAAGFEILVNKAAGLKDLEEVTGIPAELIASFGTAAAVGGTSLESIADASIKLTKNLQGVDDESKAAGAALTALGIPIEDFKKLNPGEQIEAVSKALSGFADGAEKTAVATALFGKSGAQLLPFLKALEEQGGRQVILTQAQIELADEYSDRQAKVRATLSQLAQVAAVDALPAVNAFGEAVSETAKELLGIDSAGRKLDSDSPVKEFAEATARGLALVVDAGQGVVRIFQAIGTSLGAGLATVSAIADGDVKSALEIARQGREDVDKILSAELFSQKLERAFAKAAADRKLRSVEDRGFTPSGPRINFDGAQKPAKGDKQSEAEKYLETLQKQNEQTLELTSLEKALLDIQEKRISGLTPDLEKRILAQAEFNDLNKQAIEARNAEVGVETARNRAALENLDALQKGNKELREEIALIGLDEIGILGVERARISSLRVLKEEEVARRAAAGATDESLQQLEQEIALLREREDLLGQKIGRKIEDRNIEETRKAGDKASTALADSIETGILEGYRKGSSLTEIFLQELKAQFAKTILRPAIEPIAAAGNDLISSLLGAAVSAFSSSGVGITAGDSPLSQPGAQILGRRAGGGDAHRNPGGALLVGEKGPELFRPSTSGRILSNAALTDQRDAGPQFVIENYGARIEQRRESDGRVRLIINAAASEVDRRIQRGGSTAQAMRARGLPLSGALPRRG